MSTANKFQNESIDGDNEELDGVTSDFEKFDLNTVSAHKKGKSSSEEDEVKD